MTFQKDRMNDMLKQADVIGNDQHHAAHVRPDAGIGGTTHDMVGNTRDMQKITIRIARPYFGFRGFLPAYPQLFLLGKALLTIFPFACRSEPYLIRIDGVDALTDKLQDLVADLDQIDVLMPQFIAQFPEMIAIMQACGPCCLPCIAPCPGSSARWTKTAASDRHGKGVRHRQKRRFFLPASRSVEKQRLQTQS